MKPNSLIAAITALALTGLGTGAMAECNGQKITIHANPGNGKIKVTPTTFNQKKGCGIEMRVPAGYTTNIHSAYGWLSGSSGGSDITINVPADQEDGDYKYDVEIVDFGYLDPIIRVN